MDFKHRLFDRVILLVVYALNMYFIACVSNELAWKVKAERNTRGPAKFIMVNDPKEVALSLV